MHTVLHELAHAWSFTFLAADDQEHWSEHRGLAAWHDDNAAWWKQGREQAAEVIAWGLMSEAEPFLNTWVIGENCEDLAASFRLLTRIDPLHAGNHSCRSTAMETAASSAQVEWEVEGTPEQVALAEWARERFELAGLELPAVKVTFHDDEAGCDGNTGLYRPGEPAEVHLCSRSPLESKGTRLITLHELGHGWAETRLDAETRDRFLAVRGLAAWTDSTLPTYEWGAEHAAEALSWGLMDEPVRIVRIMNHSPEALAEAFETLTGAAPLITPEA